MLDVLLDDRLFRMMSHVTVTAVTMRLNPPIDTPTATPIIALLIEDVGSFGMDTCEVVVVAMGQDGRMTTESSDEVDVALVIGLVDESVSGAAELVVDCVTPIVVKTVGSATGNISRKIDYDGGRRRQSLQANSMRSNPVLQFSTPSPVLRQ